MFKNIHNVRACVAPMLFIVCFWVASLSANSLHLSTQSESDSGKVSQYKFRADTSHVIQKKFSSEQTKKLKADPDLNYETPATVGETLWDRFLQFIGDLLASLFKNTTFTGAGKIVIWAVALAVLVYIIMVLLRVNPLTLFLKGADVAGAAEVFHENIHEMDFEKLIQGATAQKDFRTATRFVFLYALKILSDHHMIDWSAGKTNYEYVNEIQRLDLKDGFADLSTYFEYAWYGNFKVTPEIFDNMQSTFHSWRTKVEI